MNKPATKPSFFPAERMPVSGIPGYRPAVAPPLENPGECDACGAVKWNTGPRERTCGKDECIKAIYG
jgi:hypothetical protein